MTLFWRVVVINAGLLTLATLVLALSPATVSATLTATEVAVLAGGLILVIAVNVLLLRRVFGPLERLASLMRGVDPLTPGRRIELERPVAEVADLARAFNDMLDRLEHERRASGRRVLAAQERERRRLGRELHDELGQTLTGVVLQLQGLEQSAPPELHEPLRHVQDAARAGVEEVREIARGLRPAALEEFGLRAALTTLAMSFSERTGVRVQHALAAGLPPLPREHELALYRVAQESLTNVIRHAAATSVRISLERMHGIVRLSIRDDGQGIDPRAADGGGLAGMRERALLVGGRLVVQPLNPRGTEVAFEVPLGHVP